MTQTVLLWVKMIMEISTTSMSSILDFIPDSDGVYYLSAGQQRDDTIQAPILYLWKTEL